MRFEECKVGQRVYVANLDAWLSFGSDASQKEEYEAARTTSIISLDDESYVVVYKPTSIGGYTVTVADGRNFPEGWRVKPNDLQLLSDVKQIVVVPYPTRCKKCKSPARRVGNAVLCSRVKCKNGLGQKYKAPYIKRKPGVDAENYAICPECGKRASTWTNAAKGPLYCANRHEWTHKWEVGQKLSAGGDGYFYTGAGGINIWARITD